MLAVLALQTMPTQLKSSGLHTGARIKGASLRGVCGEVCTLGCVHTPDPILTLLPDMQPGYKMLMKSPV